LPPQTQLERLMARDGLTQEEALSRISSQMPLAEKAARSTHLIDTSGSIEESAQKLKNLYNKVL
ncbi:MAG: dephospho-CoA kinase, partial [Clostridia bacterium]|nr:dephospho-CoA kinase [Clostridia bacterium]